MRIYRSIGWIIALFIALVLILVAIFSFGFREFVREFIVIPIAYMIWWIGLLVKSTPQVLFWAVILFLAAFITLRSLKPGPQPESPVSEEGYGSVRRERVSFWMIQLYHGSKKYYLGRFMGFLYRLILDVLAFEGRATFSVIEKRLEQGEVEVPEEVKAFIVAGRMPESPRYPGSFRRFIWRFLHPPKQEAEESSLVQITSSEENLEKVLTFLEDQLEVTHDH